MKYYPRVFSQRDSFGRLHSPDEIIGAHCTVGMPFAIGIPLGEIDVGYAKASN